MAMDNGLAIRPITSVDLVTFSQSTHHLCWPCHI